MVLCTREYSLYCLGKESRFFSPGHAIIYPFLFNYSCFSSSFFAFFRRDSFFPLRHIIPHHGFAKKNTSAELRSIVEKCNHKNWVVICKHKNASSRGPIYSKDSSRLDYLHIGYQTIATILLYMRYGTSYILRSSYRWSLPYMHKKNIELLL